MAPWLTGREVRSVDLLAPAGPKYAGLERLAGRLIEGVGRRGKFLLMPLSGGLELVAHLGMTGVIADHAPDARASTHLRVKVELSGGDPGTLFFIDPRRFGRFLVVDAGHYPTLPTLAALGPEPLGDDFTHTGLAAACARSTMPIKAYLLSQRPVAGVGNIYADEALWRAGIHPLTPAAWLGEDQVAALHAAIREVLAAAVAAQGTTLSDYRTVRGGTGEYARQLLAYGRAGEACPRCGTEMERSVVGQRGTTHCPTCQPAPGAARPTVSAARSRAGAERARDPKAARRAAPPRGGKGGA
ncbi:MAG: bifunctional DNA-formamidopyrimidine glycosylase/DNA-(apurinic or apyrimidinic site) lyase [Trueperaceae bacterium]|nr:bifunctional DNA-formamidopyrimidine glycosylase/DNA-(apurinic or apyrimidinic site) lyase [Trueperaceae bacterium]MCW5818358.1 bifunctional DNA-formamidopyrimidine glycosylase/DNA-(apurinic or apyrimidinic site) lyase [Trueperaceae bacterium]